MERIGGPHGTREGAVHDTHPRGMTKKPYSRYTSRRRSGRIRTRVLLWSVAIIVLIFGVVGAGYYLWLHAKVSAANERVPDEVMEALAEVPDGTASLVSTTLSAGSTTTTERVPESPEAMNILLVGSDRRSATSKSYGRSDTIMLVHVDPGNDYLSTISFPRDLRVDVEGYGKQKLNNAYAYGGPALSIRTIQSLTGVDIDHYLEVDFQAFRDMTDELGGVYVEVDRRYYYNGGAYERIDLQPGYRLLGGEDALDYVRYRHDSNLDFGRMERQQRFINGLRQQAMGWDLGLKLPGLIGAFFDNVATDLGTNEFIKLAWWSIRLDGSRIRQVTLRGTTSTIKGASYVIASDDKMAAAVEDLLSLPGTQQTVDTVDPGTTTSTVLGSSLSGLEVDVYDSTAPSGSASGLADWLRDQDARVVFVGEATQRLSATQIWYPAGSGSEAQEVASLLGVENLSESGTVARVTAVLGRDLELPKGVIDPSTMPDAGVWEGVASKVSFAVRAPTYVPEGYEISKRSPDGATIYEIDVNGESEPALVMLYRRGGAVQYMNITQTTWLDAPLASPGEQVTHNGIVYTLVRVADRVERVWWKTDEVLYWVSNTLSHRVNEEDLLAVAESMVAVNVP